ncbi:hypothetical protein [Nonomuraea rubra]|uniref:Uncharacterized protein n=1 Tax=Nonomuraea rubra TaxID=46180 RepID=A0A7X0P4M2_9ACTN|nr:hypothetical protein [Nonomuraea rubra]MBB6555191.1 hypothetical protein [Nonomuraea rubra]
MTGRIVMAAMLVLAAFAVAPQAAAARSSACTWRTQALQVPTGATQHQVSATDHHGGYSGSAYFPDSGWRIVYWKDGRVIDYGSSGHGTDRVVDQNSSGTIAGTSVTGLWGASAISFRIRDGRRERLTPYPGAELNSRAIGITESGDVYGSAVVWEGNTTVYVAVRWPYDRPGVVEKVTGLPEGMRVVDVDRDGTLLVGTETTYPWPHLWRDGRLTRLPEVPDMQFGYARAVADGMVAGMLRVGSEPNRPAYWDRNGQPHQLSQSSVAEHINRNGLIVSSLTSTPFQVWRFGTLVGQLGDAASVTTIGDDDSIGGTIRGANHLPAAAVWRCS